MLHTCQFGRGFQSLHISSAVQKIPSAPSSHASFHSIILFPHTIGGGVCTLHELLHVVPAGACTSCPLLSRIYVVQFLTSQVSAIQVVENRVLNLFHKFIQSFQFV
ncbi:hypothetical protein GW750_02400 [bacterium]|nr:hypothetical protein [bacterium]